jgi:aryl-alcohol dehydrogenase-like predicted oxidoreductase
MRYRPFGVTGTAVSAVSLALTDVQRRMSVAEWTGLVYRALENGVNCFEIVGQDPAIIDGLAKGVKTLERHLIFVALRIGSTVNRTADFSAQNVARTVEAVLARTGFDHLDAVLLDDPADDALPPEALATLKALRAAGRTRMIGISGHNPAVDAYISTRAFDVLAVPYSLTSGWITRNRIRAALDQDMSIIGHSFFPQEVNNPDAPPLVARRNIFQRQAPALQGTSGGYDFLQETRGWTPEDICLAYALTQPALATVQITTDQAARLTELCDIAEREMPPGLASRIEMARFGNAVIKGKA